MSRIILYIILTTSLCAQSEPEEVIFSIKAPGADKVILSGSFNNWSNEGNQLDKKDSLWQETLELKPGYYYYRFLVDSLWTHDPANDWKIGSGSKDYISVIKVGEPQNPLRRNSKLPLPKHKLPTPILEDNPEWIDVYYSAWEILWNYFYSANTNKLSIPADYNNIKQIYAYDASLIAAFTLYAPDTFSSMQLLDLFYGKQKVDGYIPGVYSQQQYGKNQEQGSAAGGNPLLFPWLELRYYDLTGDKSRLGKVLPRLIDNFNWISEHISDPTGLGVFYDKILMRLMQYGTKVEKDKSAWIDLTCQQALAAMSIANIATVLEEDKTAQDFYIMHYFISRRINKYFWDYETNFYYDVDNTGSLSSDKQIGAFWTLLAQVSDSLGISKLLEHLVNPDEFWRPHLVPGLSADNVNYDPLGHAGRGAVQASSNYMLVKGLEEYGHYDLAREIAANHIDNIAAVYHGFIPDENSVAFEERFADDYYTIWESYSPELISPSKRKDNSFYSSQDYAGGAGIAAVAMLIENILGLSVDGRRNKVKWRINREDRHGIKNFTFRGDKIDLICNPTPNSYRFTVKCNSPFTLKIECEGKEVVKKINYGNTAFSILRQSNLQTAIEKR
jgi:hypothetical protein